MLINLLCMQQYFGAELHKRHVESRKRQTEKEKEKLTALREQYQELDAKMKQLQEEYNRR